jgi:hypothetical protein
MADKVSPPPLNAPMVDLKTGMVTSIWYRWLQSLYDKTGAASDTAPISVSGTATTITGDLVPTQLSAPVPIDKGGTGATDAASAVLALGVQTAISPGTAGDVPVSDGTDFATRRLAVTDIDGARLTQTKRGVTLNSASGAAIGDHGDTSITWDTPFADSNYTLSFSVTAATGVPIASIVSKTDTGCTVRITNATAVLSSGTGDVVGVHD